jgi:hypothetical protein
MTAKNVSDDLAKKTLRLRAAALEAIDALDQTKHNAAVSHEDRAACLDWLLAQIVLCTQILVEHRRQNPPTRRRPRARDIAAAVG